MQEQIRDKGIIIKAEPIGEYDRRVVILTENRGKISAFARGARRPNSKFVASTNPLYSVISHSLQVVILILLQIWRL